MTPAPSVTLRFRLLLLGIIAGAVALAAAVWFRPASRAELPEIPQQALSPEARHLLEPLQEKVEQQPDSGPAWGELGTALFAHQLDTAADQCFTEAARLDEQEFRWPYLNGVNLSVSQPERALGLYREALRRRSDVAVVHCRLAELLFDRGELGPAEAHWRKCVELDDRNARGWLGLARAARERGELAESRQSARRAVELSPQEKSPRAFLARVLQQLGEKELAAEELQAAQQLPDDVLAWHDPYAAEALRLRRDTNWKLRQAEELLAAGQVPEAIALLTRLVETERQSPVPAAELGRLLTEQQQFADAEPLLLAARQRFPQSSEVAFRLGVLYFTTRQLPQAAEAFETATRQNPTDFLAHYNLGQSLLLLDQPEPARRALETAVSLRPASLPARLALGRLLLDLKQPDRARVHLEAVLQIDPDHAQARELMEGLK